MNDTTTIDASKYEYSKARIRDSRGNARTVVSNGDAVANALTLLLTQGKTLESVVRANKLPMDRQDYVNNGQFRMAIGNSLRGRVRRGEAVTIGDLTIKSLEQRVNVPIEADAPAAVKKAAPKAAKKAAKKTAKKTAKRASKKDAA